MVKQWNIDTRGPYYYNPGKLFLKVRELKPWRKGHKPQTFLCCLLLLDYSKQQQNIHYDYTAEWVILFASVWKVSIYLQLSSQRENNQKLSVKKNTSNWYLNTNTNEGSWLISTGRRGYLFSSEDIKLKEIVNKAVWKKLYKWMTISLKVSFIDC